jgi:hypothetical protein
VPDHPRLGQGEPDEHPDGEQRHQLLRVPRAATSSAAAATASTLIPYRYTCRSARSANMCGRKLSLASRLASTGRPPKDVFAASASSTVVISWTA